MNESQAVSALNALSHPLRLRMVRHLVGFGITGDSAGAIGTAVGLAPSGASFHLAALERAGLLRSSRESRRIVYRVEFEALGGLINYLMTDCCRGEPSVLACCRVG